MTDTDSLRIGGDGLPDWGYLSRGRKWLEQRDWQEQKPDVGLGACWGAGKRLGETEELGAPPAGRAARGRGRRGGLMGLSWGLGCSLRVRWELQEGLIPGETRSGLNSDRNPWSLVGGHTGKAVVGALQQRKTTEQEDMRGVGWEG